ncbi:hypothetical protein ACFW96_27525 [Streptomyces gardneri]|uniref:hypothetical protein n=1 Tax=Streptomyces gardneri TaxID=66892 RepID=UPI0036C50A09
MGETSARDRLAEELRKLKAASGLTYTQIESQATKQGRRLTRSKLSNWFTGMNVPEADASFTLLVQLLEKHAHTRSGVAVRGLQWWHALQKKAAAERDATDAPKLAAGIAPPAAPAEAAPHQGDVGAAATEHGQWFRDQRWQAYLTLTQEWDAAHRRLKSIWSRAEDAYYQDVNHILQGDIGEIYNAFLDQLEEATAPTITAFQQVTMLGPSAVASAALELEQALQRLRAVTKSQLFPVPERTTGWDSEPWDEADLAATRARQVFADRVRSVLDSPPTPTPRA